MPRLRLLAAVAVAATVLRCTPAAAAAAAPPPLPYVMPLLPAALPPGNVYHNASLWSWGGSVIGPLADGRYHLYAAAFTEGCGLTAWETNSEVIHAVSATPLGPFAFSDVAIPPYAHNPQAVVHTDGTILIYTIGMQPEGKPRSCKAAGGGGGGGGDGARTGGDPGAGAHGAELIELHYSASPYGPWTQLIVPGASYNGVGGGGI